MKSNISHQILKLNSAYDIYTVLPFPAQSRSKNDRKPALKPQYKNPIWLLHYIYCLLRPYGYFMWRTDPNWTYTQIWCSKTGWALNIIGLYWKSNGPLLWYLRLSSHCRLKWPKSDFFAQMWPISDFLMTVWTAQIRFFSNQAQATFICGPKSDTYPMFCNATSVWTAILLFMQFLRHWNATDITILRWRRWKV